jgi:hypothetical protein
MKDMPCAVLEGSEGFEFRVCLRVESLDFRVEGSELGGWRVCCFFASCGGLRVCCFLRRVEGCEFVIFRVSDLVSGSAACRGMSFVFEDWGVWS